MTWKYTKMLDLGRNAEGKRIRKRAYGNTQKELDRDVARLYNEYAFLSHPSDVLFGEYAERWLKTYKSNLELNTQIMYKNAIIKLEPLYYLKLKDIRKMDIQEVLNKYWSMPVSYQKTKMTVNQIFNAAIDDGIIQSSPARGIASPKQKPSSRRAFTDEEREALRQLELDPRDRLFVDIMYAFGLRPQEAYALTFDDFRAEELTINKAVAFSSNAPVLKSTKTNATRKLPLPEEIRREVEEYEKTCTGYTYVFHSSPGRPVTQSIARAMWERIRQAMNAALGGDDEHQAVAPDFTAYLFRHDFCTRLYYVPGISDKKKAYLMGHSVQMLLNIYSHIKDENEQTENVKNIMLF